MFSANQVIFLLSGGIGNTEPKNSLGGSPSLKIISSSVNNLFGRIGKENTYRCFYVLNQSNYTIDTCTITLTQEQTNTGQISLGVESQNAKQKLKPSSTITGGDFKLKYTFANIIQETYSMSWDTSSVETALNDLTYLSGAKVTGGSFFTVEFSGGDGGRAQTLLEVSENNLTGGSLSVVGVQEGKPINAIAASIGFENQAPSSVQFSSKVIVNSLQPSDSFPLWLKRTVGADFGNEQEECNVDFSLAVTI